MAKNTIWNEQESMMANAFVNIANSLPYFAQMMKQHVKSAQNGGGIINDGDLEYILSQMANMINKNLRNVSQTRVSFTMNPISSRQAPSSSPTIPESIQRKHKVVRLSEAKLHNIIKKCINETLGSSSDDNMIAFESSHLNPNSREFTVIANFFDYTYCFKHEIVGTFDYYNEAKRFALTKIRDKDFMYGLAEDAYAEMEEDDETSIDDINFEIFDGKTSIDSPHSQPIFVTKGYASLQHS